MPTTTIESLWRQLEANHDFGGSRRISELHGVDLYALLDAEGRRSLLLLTPSAPPKLPAFAAVEITSGVRSDGQWSIRLTLREGSLSSLFAMVCNDLVNSTEHIAPDQAAAIIVLRLHRWRKLLEAGIDQTLSPAELRGLIGELLVLQRLALQWGLAEVVNGWQGPLGAAQDFALYDRLVEVKSILPSASTFHVNSVEQLDPPQGAPQWIVTVTLTNSTADGAGRFSAASLIRGIRADLASNPDSAFEFESRLNAVGYVDHPEYDHMWFRFDGLRVYKLSDEFPRLKRAMIHPGVSTATYEVLIAACSAFESSWESLVVWN